MDITLIAEVSQRYQSSEQNEILKDFSINRDLVDRIGFYFISKVSTKKWHQILLLPIAQRFPKLDPYASSLWYILVHK